MVTQLLPPSWDAWTSKTAGSVVVQSMPLKAQATDTVIPLFALPDAGLVIVASHALHVPSLIAAFAVETNPGNPTNT